MCVPLHPGYGCGTAAGDAQGKLTVATPKVNYVGTLCDVLAEKGMVVEQAVLGVAAAVGSRGSGAM